MWISIYSKLKQALKKGYGSFADNVPDQLLFENLRTNAATFAAFKNHNEIREIQQLLTTNGKLTPWKQFRDAALEISDKYNKRWLQTEYNHAVQSSRMARKWQSFQEDADLYPNLEYVAVMDDRTRDEHAELDGSIYPIDHTFWDSYFPPNGWGCRCTVRQTDAETKEAKVIPDQPDMFKNNPGKSGKVFTETSPYFNVEEGTAGDIMAFVNKQNPA